MGAVLEVVCLAGKGKMNNYRGCYSLNPLGEMVDFKNRKKDMIGVGGIGIDRVDGCHFILLFKTMGGVLQHITNLLESPPRVP